ncbi:ATPase [Subtercola sp. Z020]|uniref:AAA family ATPase n=1 Tax=Subtercola sp. Z020 TaxID=2080582 RepID=UPI000CE86075|nr:SMC family ATPase [Subtercola sp. Z020]PPF87847.1 ATPase [Subtercola sp. Z020]
MKITKLRLAGFGPYKDEQRVDFELFDDDGIFLITGKTGAGKSSILDAICFALYATVPRYDGRESQLRSDHAEPGDPTFVELEFSIGEHDYRLYRTPEYKRPKRRGEGLTTAAPEARLEIRDAAGGGWRGLAAKPVDVGRYMSEILPLRADQFLQVILLAQNRFQQFLLAKTDERRTLLRTLFGTARFEAFEKSLTEQSRALSLSVTEVRQNIRLRAGQAVALADAAVARGAGFEGAGYAGAEFGGAEFGCAEFGGAEPGGAGFGGAGAGGADSGARATAVPENPGLEWFGALAVTVDDLRRAAADRAAEAAGVFERADLAHTAQLDLRRRQQKRAAAEATLDALVAESPAVDLLRASVADAARAAQAWPHVESRRASEAELQRALGHEQVARAAWGSRADVNTDVDADAAIHADADAVTHADADAATDADADAAAAADAAADVGSDAEATPGGTATAAALRAVVEGLVAERASLESVLVDEQRVQRLQAELTELAARRHAASAEVAGLDERLRGVPARLDELNAALSLAQVEAGRLPDAEKEQRSIAEALAAAARADRAVTQLDAALLQQKSASTAHLAAARLVDDLLTRRLAGHAVELAAELRQGEPCAVCGSTEHPEPAASDREPVTELDTDRAQHERAARQAELAEADARVAELGQTLAAERAGARGRSAVELRAEAEVAAEAVRAATAAAARQKTLETERREVTRTRERDEQRLAGLRDELDSAALAHTAAETSLALSSLRVLEMRAGHASVAARVAALDDRLALARAFEEALTATAKQLDRTDRARVVEGEQLAVLGFDDAQAVDAALLSERERSAREARIRRHDDARAAAEGLLADPELAGLPGDPVDAGPTELARAEAIRLRDAAVEQRSTLTAELNQLTVIVDSARALFTASASLIDEQQKVRELAEVVAGGGSNTRRMRLETYVLAAQLEQIIVAANQRLTTMTGGRYSLELDDSLQYRNAEAGLGLSIRDEHTGRARPTHSLSGGETFLASLALALGLAEVVSIQTGGIALDTLFVDEGFGSLDAETLEIAMSTLDGLRTGGRTIGLISHVDSMKEQISAKLRVTVTAAGYSEIEEVRERV